MAGRTGMVTADQAAALGAALDEARAVMCRWRCGAAVGWHEVRSGRYRWRAGQSSGPVTVAEVRVVRCARCRRLAEYRVLAPVNAGDCGGKKGRT